MASSPDGILCNSDPGMMRHDLRSIHHFGLPSIWRSDIQLVKLPTFGMWHFHSLRTFVGSFCLTTLPLASSQRRCTSAPWRSMSRFTMAVMDNLAGCSDFHCPENFK